MRGDGQPRLSLDASLAQIDIFTRPRVDDLNVHPLVGPGADVGRDDDESVLMRRVPNAFRFWIAVSG